MKLGDGIIADVRGSLRAFMRTPRFTALAILPLAFAGAGTITLVSLLFSVVMRPLAVPEPQRLAMVTAFNDRGVQGFISLTAVQELERMRELFDAVCGTIGVDSERVKIGDRIVVVTGETMTGQCARLLGGTPTLGRMIGERDVAGTEPVVVISPRLWREHFSADPEIIGRILVVEGLPLTIIGVAPAGTMTTSREQTPDVVMPLTLMQRMLNTPIVLRAYYVTARLAPGVTIDAARSRLTAVWPHILASAASDPVASRYMKESTRIRVENGTYGISPLRTRYARPLQLLGALAGLLLVAACTNVGGIYLARVKAREAELVTHIALGATPRRMGLRLLGECVILALAATVVALPLAFWSTRLMARALWTSTLPLALRVTPDASVIALALVGALISGILVGLPATVWWVTSAAHRGGSAGSAQSRTVLLGLGVTGKLLVVVQMAIAFGLLCAAVMFMQSLLALRQIDPGYQVTGLVSTRPGLMPGPPPKIDASAYMRDLTARLSSLRGVRGTALSFQFPLARAERTNPQPVNTADAAEEAEGHRALIDLVSPAFFETTGIRVVKGRVFGEHDDVTHPPVAVVSLALARQLFGDKEPIGQRVRIGGTAKTGPLEIVGIVDNASIGDIRIPRGPVIYQAIFQRPEYLRNPVITLRAHDTEELRTAVRDTVDAFGYNYISTFSPIEELVARSTVTERVLTGLSWFVGGLAIVVATLGLYSLLSFSLAQRRRELAVRIALGASGRTLAWSVFRDGLVLVAIGLGGGIPLALLLIASATRTIGNVTPPRFELLLGVTALLTIAGLCGAWAPARRTGRLEPASVLRGER